MANTTIRQLGDASPLKANDYLLIAQEDGTTKKVPLNRLISEGMVASDSSGETAMVTRAKIWVGAYSSLTDLEGVERSASDQWDDKAWNLVHPGRGNTAEDIKATDFCHFVAVEQPVPMFVLNRPFINLHEAMTWARYNVPGGWDLQFDFVGHTNCWQNADKLGQFSPNFMAGMNLNIISFITKHRFIGSYNETTKAWDLGKANAYEAWNWIRWIPDAKGQGGPNSESTARGTYAIGNYLDRRALAANFATRTALSDIYCHFSGSAALRMWFRDIPKVYICGVTWADYAHGPRHGNQRFFRISNGRLHMFGEAILNLEAAMHPIANQRGNSFITKHGSSTILECMEGGSAYIMCNLRHYSCGTTTSYYNKRQHHVSNDDPDSALREYSPQDVGLSKGDFQAAAQQIVRIAEVGSTGSSVSGGATVVFDPLFHGWYRSLGILTADVNTLLYHDGKTLKSNGATMRDAESVTSSGFINWGKWQNHEWLTGGHGNINDPSWTIDGVNHYDVESLNWYYLGVTPTGYTDQIGQANDTAYKWDVSKASSALPWQAWKMASVTNGGTYAETIPGVVTGPYIRNNNDANHYLTNTGDHDTGTERDTQPGTDYSFWDGRGYRHFMKSMMSTNQLTSQSVYGSDVPYTYTESGGIRTPTSTPQFLQHYATGKNTRIAATINSPCSASYSFGSADAKIYLARHYNVRNYVPDVWQAAAAGHNADFSSFSNPNIAAAGIYNLYNFTYGSISKHSWHVNTSAGTHHSVLPGNVYPCANTTTNPFGSFRYQENNALVDHARLCGEEVRNYPLIGGSELVKFSKYPGEFKDFATANGQPAAEGIGVGQLFITQLPVISQANSWSYSGTWNFAQYQFSHQNYKANTDDATGHYHLPKPLATHRTTWTSGIAEDEIIMYWFDLEARPAIHAFTEGLNLMDEPYWWPEHTAYYWNQRLGSAARGYGDAAVDGSGG